MNKKTNEYSKNEYLYRVNMIIDYINIHYDQKLSLKELSRVANFSEFHFHRIFKSITNETLTQYIQRIRIEKAAFQLLYNPSNTITDIAFSNGFNSSQFFSRVFKDYFDQNPKEWRKNSKIMQENAPPFFLNYKTNIGGQSKMQNISINIQEIPDMYVAYLRYIGSYKGNIDLYTRLFSKLFKWADSHNIFTKETRILALYNDLTDITDESKLKLTVCITIDNKITPSPPFGKLKIIGGKYAICRFEILKDDFENAWNAMYGEWLPQSGYLPDDKPSFELFYNDPYKHPEHKHIVDLCIPVKLMGDKS